MEIAIKSVRNINEIKRMKIAINQILKPYSCSTPKVDNKTTK